ncbi:MAG: hypothetical protein B7733_23585 [Myxococcales bacterium FL481]|nr:MAG: hypothetical protein B7733_23585 [Myxococcales bacterium FL481]
MTLWLLGGIDPTGGAGLWRDSWAAQVFAPDLRIRAVVTAWTWQGRGQRARAQGADLAHFRANCHGLADAQAVKIGLLPSAVAVTLAAMHHGARPWVVDPVLGATSGGTFDVSMAALVALRRDRVVFTPNQAEAQALLGTGAELSTSQLHALARQLSPSPVLVKSARQDTTSVADVLIAGHSERWFVRSRQPGPDPRGTGCALSTAIAAGLAHGRSLVASIDAATKWLDGRRTQLRNVGGGHHFR